MGSGGGSKQTTTSKVNEELNQQSLLLQQKQELVSNKTLAEEQYQTDLSEWEAGQLSKAQRAAGAARRAGVSLFDASSAEDGKPTEVDTTSYDEQIAALDSQIAASKARQKKLGG